MLDQKFWERYCKAYDILNLAIPYQELLKEIVIEAEIKPGDFVLEAGVGTGNLALKLKDHGASVIGLDYSEVALEIYRKKDSTVKTILHNLEDLPLPFADNYFDKIVSNNTLYNISNGKHPKVLKEFKRILKPGGKIVLSNILKTYKPFVIYLDTIKKNIEKYGNCKTLILILRMLIPTLKIFYYNSYIQKEFKISKKSGFGDNEQGELLRDAGFVKVSENKYVFSNQAVMNSGYKNYENTSRNTF